MNNEFIDFKKDVIKEMRELYRLSPDAVQPHIRRTIKGINNNMYNDTIEESINQGGSSSDCVDLLLAIAGN
tara:strand:+ start:192 stop:404 length:213 start_codon:yes stop_codon:yes gene_type:complete